jgi:hypothetical protein
MHGLQLCSLIIGQGSGGRLVAEKPHAGKSCPELAEGIGN